jgi:hypothetical protein
MQARQHLRIAALGPRFGVAQWRRESSLIQAGPQRNRRTRSRVAVSQETNVPHKRVAMASKGQQHT